VQFYLPYLSLPDPVRSKFACNDRSQTSSPKWSMGCDSSSWHLSFSKHGCSQGDTVHEWNWREQIFRSHTSIREGMKESTDGIWPPSVSSTKNFTSSTIKIFLHCIFSFWVSIQRSYIFVIWEQYRETLNSDEIC
jgi:hypothetical protein